MHRIRVRTLTCNNNICGFCEEKNRSGRPSSCEPLLLSHSGTTAKFDDLKVNLSQVSLLETSKNI